MATYHLADQKFIYLVRGKGLSPLYIQFIDAEGSDAVITRFSAGSTPGAYTAPGATKMVEESLFALSEELWRIYGDKVRMADPDSEEQKALREAEKDRQRSETQEKKALRVAEKQHRKDEKQRERDEAKEREERRKQEILERAGAPIKLPDGIGIHLYEREVWRGYPWNRDSLGGSLRGVRAEYSVTGNFVNVSDGSIRVPGFTFDANKQKDMRTFVVQVAGADFRFTASLPAMWGRGDRQITDLVNIINNQSMKFNRTLTDAQTAPVNIPGSASPITASAPASLAVNEQEFAAAKARLLS